MSELSKFDAIAKTIGDVCIWWGHNEGVIHDISLHMAAALDRNFDEGHPRHILHVALSTIDGRQRIKMAKAIAAELNPKRSRGFYDKLQKLLDYIDNDVRIERNRYVHDLWDVDGHEIRRMELSPRVTRPQSRQRVLELWSDRQYETIEEVQAFVSHLELIYEDLVTLDNHIAWLGLPQEPPPTHAQPLPERWPCFDHQGWRARKARKPPPPPSVE